MNLNLKFNVKFNLILNTSKYTAGNLKYEVQVELEVPSLRVTRAGVTVTASASLSLTRRSAAVPVIVPLAVPLPVLDFKLDTQPELTGTLEAGTQAGRLAAEPPRRQPATGSDSESEADSLETRRPA